MTGIELIADGAQPLAYVIRQDAVSPRTDFFTGDDSSFQGGFVVYPAGGRVEAHAHLPVVRTVVGTSELLVVRTGRCFVDIYTDEHHLIATRELLSGDAVLSVGGGHGFRMVEDTLLLEVKQGPYGGPHEKQRFATNPDGEPL